MVLVGIGHVAALVAYTLRRKTAIMNRRPPISGKPPDPCQGVLLCLAAECSLIYQWFLRLPHGHFGHLGKKPFDVQSGFVPDSTLILTHCFRF